MSTVRATNLPTWTVPSDIVAWIAREAIGLYVEYVEQHGHEPDQAADAAVADTVGGAAVNLEALEAEMADAAPRKEIDPGNLPY